MIRGERIPDNRYVTSVGQWFRLRRREFVSACCDCGLVHVVTVKPLARGMLIRFIRANRATAYVRRVRRAKQGKGDGR